MKFIRAWFSAKGLRFQEGTIWFPPVLLFLVLGFYWRVLFDHQTFVFVDASRFFYPLWKWGSAVLAQGVIPLWNPDAQFGTPYLADPQMACAYPPLFLLYSFLGPVNAFDSLVVLHHFWALLGFWVFARKQGFSTPASLMGGFIFAFSLHVVCSSWTPVAMMTISWIPWVFLSAEKVFRGEKGGFLCLSVAWALQFAAGYPVLVYLTAIAVGAHYTWVGFVGPLPKPSPLAGEGTLIFLNGRAGPVKGNEGDPVLPLGRRPSIEEQGRVRGDVTPKATLTPALSPRGRGGKNSKPVSNLNWIFFMGAAGIVAVVYNLAWGLPFLEMTRYSNYENGAIRYHDLGWWDFGTLLNPFDQGHPLYSGYHGPHYWVSTFFIGLPPLGLLIWGFSRRVFKRTSWGLLLLFLVLSVGVLNVGHLLGKIIPGLGMVIHSGFWLSLLVFWAAWMSMEASETLIQGPAPRGGRFLWGGLIIGLGMISFALAPVFMPIPWALSLVAGFALIYWKNPRVRWGLLGLSVFLSLFLPAQSLNILLDRSYYEKPPTSLEKLSEPGRLFFTPPLLERSIHLQGSDMKDAYDGAKTNVYPNWPLVYGREEAPMYNTLQLRHSFDWTFQAFQVSEWLSRDVVDYLGIRYLFGKNHLPGLRHISDQPWVDQVMRPAPKWFAARHAYAAGLSVKEDLAMANQKTLDLARDCFIEDGSKAGPYVPRRVVYSAPDPNLLGLKAAGQGKALVVSSETAYPGWTAQVNGQTRPLELVNHAFRGIVLGAGETSASMSFQPLTFRVGLFLTLLVLGFWSFLLGRRFLDEF